MTWSILEKVAASQHAFLCQQAKDHLVGYQTPSLIPIPPKEPGNEAMQYHHYICLSLSHAGSTQSTTSGVTTLVLILV